MRATLTIPRVRAVRRPARSPPRRIPYAPLEAAHVRPYAAGGEHRICNGLALRSGIHRLREQRSTLAATGGTLRKVPCSSFPLLVLQQEFTSDPGHVRIVLRANVVDLDERRLVGTETFEVVEQAPSQDAYGGVVATNRALEQLLEQIARSCVQTSGKCRADL